MYLIYINALNISNKCAYISENTYVCPSVCRCDLCAICMRNGTVVLHGDYLTPLTYTLIRLVIVSNAKLHISAVEPR